MKVKYIGEQPIVCIDFQLAGVVPNGIVEPGKTYDVPEDDNMVLAMLEASPVFEQQKEAVKKSKGDK